MAYSKKTWKARQGLGLNKFSIDGATPVPVVNQPDSVTQQGDALSAGNLNDLENRIANAFDDVEEGKADKSEIDDLQNQIINLNTSVDTLDAIVGCEAEIENTDPSEGQSILASSRLIHHVNLLPSGEFGLVGARDVKWNQLQYNGNFASSDGWSGGTVSSGHIEASGSANSYSRVYTSTNNPAIIQGHVYFASAKMKAISGLASGYTSYNLRIGGEYSESTALEFGSDGIANGTTITVSGVFTASANNAGANPLKYWGCHNDTNAHTAQWSDCNIFDLTAMGLSTLTADQFRSMFGASYYPYNAGSIVNLNPTGFSVRGINLWDEVTSVAGINSSTGQDESGNTIRSDNYIPVTPSETYYIKATSSYGNGLAIFEYDVNKNYLGVFGSYFNASFSVSANTYYIRFTPWGGTTYNHDIQICDNTLPTSVKTVYHPYNGKTVPVSISGHYVNENVYDYVTNKTVNGVLRGEVHTKVFMVDLGELEWVKYTSHPTMFYVLLSDLKNYATSDLADILCDKYETIRWTSLDWTKPWVESHDKYLDINDPSYESATAEQFKTAMSGHYCLLALADETVTYTEPLRSFNLTDYATIEPITPQTLPNRVDVPFSVLSKSNNGLIEQIRTNTADIADNKAILSQHEARIANLEQVSGDYVTSDMQDYSTTPSGKASYALVETLKGVSRVENQLIDAYHGRGSTTVTKDSDGYYNITVPNWTSGTCGIYFDTKFKANHTYLSMIETKLYNITESPNYRCYDPQGQYLVNTDWKGTGKIAYDVVTVNANCDLSGMLFTPSSNTESLIIKVTGIDLNVYFNTSDLSFLGATDSAKLATIQSKYPELLEPRAYNAGEIVDSTYTKVESQSRNLLNPSTLNGAGTWNDGVLTSSPESLFSLTKVNGWSDIRFIPNTKYYVRAKLKVGSTVNSLRIQINYTDGSSFSSSSVSSGAESYIAVTSTEGKSVQNVLFNYSSGGGGDAFVSEFIIKLSDASDGAFSPYFTDTLTIPSVTLRSAGSVAEVYDLETGKVTHPLGVLICDENTNWNINGSVFYISLADGVVLPINKDPNIIVQNYEVVGTRNVASFSDKTCSVIAGTSAIGIRDDSYSSTSDFTTAMIGKTILYELATPTTESVTTTLDNTLKTEGGGTVYTDADVDGQFTMGFLNL